MTDFYNTRPPDPDHQDRLEAEAYRVERDYEHALDLEVRHAPAPEPARCVTCRKVPAVVDGQCGLCRGKALADQRGGSEKGPRKPLRIRRAA